MHKIFLNELIKNSDNILSIIFDPSKSDNLAVTLIFDKESIPEDDSEYINKLILVSDGYYGPIVKFSTDVPMERLLSKIDLLVDNNIRFTLNRMKNNIKLIYIYYNINIYNIIDDYIRSLKLCPHLKNEDISLYDDKRFPLYKIKTLDEKEYFALDIKNTELSEGYIKALGFYPYKADLNKYLIFDDKLAYPVISMMPCGFINITQYKNKEYELLM